MRNEVDEKERLLADISCAKERMTHLEETAAQMKNSSHVEINSERSKSLALSEEMKALQKKHESER